MQNTDLEMRWRNTRHHALYPSIDAAASGCGASGMVSVGNKNTGRTGLAFLNGNLNWQRYLNDIIIPGVVPNLQRFGNGTIYQSPVVRN